MGTIKGVELINDDVTKRVGFVIAPEFLGVGLDQQVIQHFVVCEEDVGRTGTQGGFFGDDFIRLHDGAGGVVLITNVKSGGDSSVEGGSVVDQFGDALGLVGGQGVHGIDEDGFDAGGACLLTAMVKERVEEALRFAGTSASSNEGGFVVGGGEAGEGAFLVQVRGELHRNVAEVSRSDRARSKG